MRVPAPLQVNNTNEHYVTCWHRYDEKAGRFVYNHYSDGLSMLERPFYKSTEQKNSWQNAVWRKTYGKLVNSTIINL